MRSVLYQTSISLLIDSSSVLLSSAGQTDVDVERHLAKGSATTGADVSTRLRPDKCRLQPTARQPQHQPDR